MLKIAIINHTFEDKRFYKRWELLAQEHPDIDITLLAPIDYTYGNLSSLTYGFEIYRHGEAVDKENFHIELIDFTMKKFRTWKSKMMPKVLRRIKPDFIYFVGVHTYDAIQDIISIRNKHMPNTKILVFSMRGVALSNHIKKGGNPIKQLVRLGYYFYNDRKLKRFNKNVDAVFCHYPDAITQFKKEGFNGPIFMQTQVGVDKDVFFYSSDARNMIREKYGISLDTYLFGSATRFNSSKGLMQIIRSLPSEGNWKYLMVGWGNDSEVEAIRKEIDSRGLQDKIILTGYIDTWEEMAKHWNAVDCAVHFPLTTADWEETFSLSLVQAMITGLPVIGSSSGSVPYQLGPEGIIIDEYDLDGLHDQFVQMINKPEHGKIVGGKMYKRAMECFEIRHLNEMFYDTLIDLSQGIYDPQKIDMTQYKVIT